MTYQEKLLNPKWQRKRQDILTRDNYTCCLCSDTETTLHVHHKDYIYGNEPWEYEDDNFQTLCKHCHSVVEYFKQGQYQAILVGKSKRAGCICLSVVCKNEGKRGVAHFHFDPYSEKIVCDVILSEGAAKSIYDILQLSEKLYDATTNSERLDRLSHDR